MEYDDRTVDKFLIRTIDKNHCLAVWDKVLIQIWRGPCTDSSVANLAQVAYAFIEEQPEKISSLSVVESSSPPPSDQVRTRLSRFYRDISPKVNKAIVVAEGGGFRAAIVRGVGLTLSTLSPKTLPFTFSSSIQDASRLIAPFLSRGAGGTLALEAVVDEVRAELSKHIESL